MSFNFQVFGHAETKEAEEHVVRAAHEFWAKVKEHVPGAHNAAHTSHHGVGHIDALTDPDDPDKNVTVDEDGGRHLDVPASPSSSVSASSTPSGGSDSDGTPPASSYEVPSESAPQGDPSTDVPS